MSNGVNKVILIGNAGQDAEVKSTSTGKSVASFSLAVNEGFRGKSGKSVKRVEWVRCVAWSKLAEVAGKYVRKGKQVFVEGRLQTRKYQDSEVTFRLDPSPSTHPRTAGRHLVAGSASAPDREWGVEIGLYAGWSGWQRA